MPWFKVDDGFCMHPKVAAAGNSAIGLWVRAGSWSSQQLTDGHVPDTMVNPLGASQEDAEQLVRVGLWQRIDGGYQFWQWPERQPTRKQVESKRSQARDRMRRSRGNEPSPEAVASSGARSARAAPNQTRPRASPLPDVFPLTNEMRTWATANASGVDIDREHQRFCDYYKATGKQMADWHTRWRAWVRESQERTTSQASNPRPDASPEADLWVPEDPPPEVANDPERYREWMREQHSQHRREAS